MMPKNLQALKRNPLSRLCSRAIKARASTFSLRTLAWLLLVALSACSFAQSRPGDNAEQNNAQPDDVPEANPARPTVATPATLTPVGYLQFENGLLYAADSPEFSSRLGVNQVTKLAVNQWLQFLLQSEPLVHSGLGLGKERPVKESNPGDVLAGVQAVLLPGHEKRPTIALSYFKHVYAGSAPDVDFGTPEHSLIVLISGDLAGFHFDLNGMFNEQLNDHVGRAQFGQTISISHPVRKFTIAAELWHFTQPFLKGNAVGNLWAVSYPLRRNLVLDAGFNRGLTGSSTQWEGFAGFTYLLPRRLWRQKTLARRIRPGLQLQF